MVRYLWEPKAVPCRHASCNSQWRNCGERSASPIPQRHMPCATLLPHTFWHAVGTCAPSRSCWATPRCRRHRSTRRSTPIGYWKSIAAPTRARSGVLPALGAVTKVWHSAHCRFRPLRMRAGSLHALAVNRGRIPMSHGVHAVQHEAEHQIEHEQHGHGHGKGSNEGQNKKIALLIAVIALFLAFSETLGKSAQTAFVSYNIAASNLWAFYQAKTIRQTTLEASAELIKLDRLKIDGESSKDALLKAMSDRVDNWTRTVARYNSEPMDRPVAKDVNLNPPYGEGRRELMALALAAEAKRDTVLERYHHYEVASAAYQIGIVLAAAAVITGMIVLAYVAAGLGVLGVIFTAIGLFAPHAVHLF